MTHKNLYIDGYWLAGSGPEFHSINPATGEIVWTGNSATADDVNRAMDAARREKLFASWNKAVSRSLDWIE